MAEFLLQLIGAQDDMALRNGELAHTDETVHLAGILIAEQGGGLTQAHGEIAVAAGAVEEYLVMEWAGHGAQGKAFLGLIVGIAQHKHAIQVMIPVAGDLIELALGHQGGLGEEVAALLLGILYPALHQLDHPGALGQQDRQALADDINGGEVFQLTAQLIVVAAAGFLQPGQVFFQHTALGEGAAVNTAEHLILFAAAPVGAGAAGQLDRLDGAGGHEVGAGAQVGKIALAAESDGFALAGVLLNELQLIGLIGHQLFGLLHRQGEALNGQILLGDGSHFGLQLFQVLRGEGGRDIEIVVEAILDGGADGKLGAGEQVLHRLGQDVGSGVIEGALALLILKGEDLHGAVVIQQIAEIRDLAIHQGAAGIAVQAHAQILGKIGDGLGSGQLLDRAIFQGDFDHDKFPPFLVIDELMRKIPKGRRGKIG